MKINKSITSCTKGYALYYLLNQKTKRKSQTNIRVQVVTMTTLETVDSGAEFKAQPIGERLANAMDDVKLDPIDDLKMNQTNSINTPSTKEQIKKTQSDLFVLRQRSALPSFAKNARFEWRNLNGIIFHTVYLYIYHKCMTI